MSGQPTQRNRGCHRGPGYRTVAWPSRTSSARQARTSPAASAGSIRYGITAVWTHPGDHQPPSSWSRQVTIILVRMTRSADRLVCRILFLITRQAGLEPATCRLGTGCSVQLSYCRYGDRGQPREPGDAGFGQRRGHPGTCPGLCGRCPAGALRPQAGCLGLRSPGALPGAYGKPGRGKDPCPISGVRGQARPQDNQDNLR